jgi:hypothetical protein
VLAAFHAAPSALPTLPAPTIAIFMAVPGDRESISNDYRELRTRIRQGKGACPPVSNGWIANIKALSERWPS